VRQPSSENATRIAGERLVIQHKVEPVAIAERVSIDKLVPQAAFLLVLALFSLSVEAQQSYRSHQELSGRVLRNAGQPDKKPPASQGLPMRFKGWKHPGKYRSGYPLVI
jgi:hypothetical protein